MKVILDTNVYLRAVRSDETRETFRATLFRLLPLTLLSAIVAYELSVDAKGRRTRALVREFVAPMEQTGRIVTPRFADWLKAADVITAIHEREPDRRSKLPVLLNDVLIALGARDTGATLFTYNRADFELIQRRGVAFSLRVLED